MVKKLRKMPYAQAQVRDYGDIDEDLIVLQSYQTDVIIIRNSWLECTGLYSSTTRRHISAFMKEYGKGFNYFDVKEAYEKGYKLNILTGDKKFKLA